jgi:hypothetical protein
MIDALLFLILNDASRHLAAARQRVAAEIYHHPEQRFFMFCSDILSLTL